MSQASGSDGRTEMERGLIQRSLEDDAFRDRLLADPKAAVEQELGTPLPEGVRIVAIEETADTVYLVIPSVSGTGAQSDELSDSELEAVAGGDWGPSTNSTCGENTCQIHCPTI